MVTAQNPVREFPVDWREPEDADKFWVWDGMHCPKPLTPLSVDFALAVMRAQKRLAAPANPPPEPQFLNGYFYGSFQPPDPNAPEDPAQKERQLKVEADAKVLSRLWGRRWLPRVKRLAASILDADCPAMSVAELTGHLDRSMRGAGLAFGVTLIAAEPMIVGIQKLYEFCEKELGPEGVALAGASVQGYRNESSASDSELWRVATLARRLGLEAGVRGASGSAALTSGLESSAKGREFLVAFRRYLDRYGWRTPAWWEMSQPSWRERPDEPLQVIRRYLGGEAEEPGKALGRGARGRRAALRELRRRIPDDKLGEFEDAWKTARPFVAVSEGRALWQLSLSGILRVPALALGEKLRAAGVLASPDDIFYLRLDEIVDGGDQSGWRGLTAGRRRDREHYMALVPPLTLGRFPVPPSSAEGAPPRPIELPFGARMVTGFGGERSNDERILKGHAASPGVVQGRAKVVETVDQAGKVEPGDILVCRFTTPSWAHLFSQVSAIVADSGGVLSHCAILAREYGIPCVPGVRVGTRRITDGMLLTVDGGQGIVRLED